MLCAVHKWCFPCRFCQYGIIINALFKKIPAGRYTAVWDSESVKDRSWYLGNEAPWDNIQHHVWGLPACMGHNTILVKPLYYEGQDSPTSVIYTLLVVVYQTQHFSNIFKIWSLVVIFFHTNGKNFHKKSLFRHMQCTFAATQSNNRQKEPNNSNK